MKAVSEIAPLVGIVVACVMLAVARATYYRRLQVRAPQAPRKPSPRALTEQEGRAVFDVLHEPRFVDHAPAEVYATLLDEGQYLYSERTMHRVLEGNQEVRERRNQLRHANHPRPELLATRPNELWSWDITKLLGPQKWTYFYLYEILDVFSRYVVGWMVAHEESKTLVTKLIDPLIVAARSSMPRSSRTRNASLGDAPRRWLTPLAGDASRCGLDQQALRGAGAEEAPVEAAASPTPTAAGAGESSATAIALLPSLPSPESLMRSPGGRAETILAQGAQ